MGEYEGFSEDELLAGIDSLRALLSFPWEPETVAAAEELLAEMIEAHRLGFRAEAEGF